VELKRYDTWNLALQIDDFTLSNVVKRKFAESKIQWSHLSAYTRTIILTFEGNFLLEDI
jgi:hypothetical protein